MFRTFGSAEFRAQLREWCRLYVRFVEQDSHRLADLVSRCPHDRIQKYLDADASQIPRLLKANAHIDQDYLIAWGLLQYLEIRYQASHCQPLNPPAEISLGSKCYLLVSNKESPILRAIPDNKRFKLDNELGDHRSLNLKYNWRPLENSTEIDYAASVALDFLLNPHQSSVRIGLSPLAENTEMDWACDEADRRGPAGHMPFWCCGAKDELELLGRLQKVLALARENAVNILIFPELVMTETLQTGLIETLVRDAFAPPVVRLIVAGTRHIHADDTFSNRCTVFNHLGEVEWTQDKRQPFTLSAKEAQALFGPTCPAAFEPAKTGDGLTMRKTALGIVASPICLDFIHDSAWEAMPVQLFLVPAMSDGLSRFRERCRQLGKKGAAVFICNASRADTCVIYRPSKPKHQPDVTQLSELFFIVDVDIEMN